MTASTSTSGKKKSSAGQWIVVVLVLLLGAGGAGFGVGFTQKFAPIEMVAPGTPGVAVTTSPPTTSTPTTTTATATTPPATSAAPASTTGTTAASPGTATSTTPAPSAVKVKKTYWLSTHGWEGSGYDVNVYVNDNLVGTYSKPAQTADITNFVKPGDNKVRFEAKALSDDKRNDFSGAHLIVKVNRGDAISKDGGEALLDYKRTVSEKENFDDTMDFKAE